MDGNSVLRAVNECGSYLGSVVDRDWAGTPVPGLKLTVSGVVAHIGDCLLWYSTDLAAGDRELSTMDVRVRPESAPEDLIATLNSLAAVLAHVVDGSPAGARGWHPFGKADRSGFAAMACDELLVHTADVAAGLGRPFVPSEEIAEATLRRLFPWAPEDTDPWTTLLWANGRADLPGQERQVGWRWHCAPLEEWDGSNPRSQ
jgi:hypothetical protein